MAMAMDMDDHQFRQQHGWSLRLQSGQEMRFTPPPEANEPLCVTDVFLVDPKSAAGQGAMAAFVNIGTQTRILGVLSSERPREKLHTPVELNEEFCFYLMRLEGEHDADADADAVVVQFQGYALPSANTKEEIEEEDEEDDRADEENHDEEEESDGKDTVTDDEDATGSDCESYEYDSRDDGEVCGLPLGTVIEDEPSLDGDEEVSVGEAGGRRTTRARGSGRKQCRRRRSFVPDQAEGQSLEEPAPPLFAFDPDHSRRRRVSPEAVVLAIFVFLYLIAMVVLIRG